MEIVKMPVVISNFSMSLIFSLLLYFAIASAVEVGARVDLIVRADEVMDLARTNIALAIRTSTTAEEGAIDPPVTTPPAGVVTEAGLVTKNELHPAAVIDYAKYKKRLTLAQDVRLLAQSLIGAGSPQKRHMSSTSGDSTGDQRATVVSLTQCLLAPENVGKSSQDPDCHLEVGFWDFINLTLFSSDALLALSVLFCAAIGGLSGSFLEEKDKSFSLFVKVCAQGLAVGLVAFLVLKSGKAALVSSTSTEPATVNPFGAALVGFALGRYADIAFTAMQAILQQVVKGPKAPDGNSTPPGADLKSEVKGT
ncbi:MAG: hypothetical protein IV100_09870 [Myxococcales bacterium]|nr:hypothetical protein [Myxococcales bacterium]